MDLQFLEESKQAQREKFIYLSVGVRKYNFSYSGLDYAKRFFETNGVTGSLPSLAYDDSDALSTELMDPLLKIGIIRRRAMRDLKRENPKSQSSYHNPR